MIEDNIKGTARKIEGAAESAFGNLTGNKSVEARGEARKAVGAVQNAAGDAEDKVLSLVGRVEESVRDIWNNAGDNLHQATDKVNRKINEKPVRASLVSLGLGFILGALIVR